MTPGDGTVRDMRLRLGPFAVARADGR
jgi:hypothetical protein